MEQTNTYGSDEKYQDWVKEFEGIDKKSYIKEFVTADTVTVEFN